MLPKPTAEDKEELSVVDPQSKPTALPRPKVPLNVSRQAPPLQPPSSSSFFFFLKKKARYFFNTLLFIYLFIFGCVGSSFLCEGFLQLRQAGATLPRCARASHCCGLSLWSTGSRRVGSVVVVHGLSCSVACGIFPDQGSNPCPLNRQADSQPLRH